MEVIVAHAAGTCFGVKAAIEIAQDKRKPVLGPLVHNPKVVSDLAQSGIPIYNRYTNFDELKNQGVNEVIITAHGYPKQLKEELTKQGIQYHDATCPVLLKWVYKKIEEFDRAGHTIVIIGNPEHAEIRASCTYASRPIYAAYSEEQIDALPNDLQNVVAICQTTITKEKFEYLVGYLRGKFPALKAVDTRCKPVKNQQEAVERLAQWVDAMIIVGGFDSSNTANLARLSQKYLPEKTYYIDSPALIKAEWFEGVKNLGLGAGTSTPKAQIDEVRERIMQLSPTPVEFRQTTKDGEVIDINVQLVEEVL